MWVLDHLILRWSVDSCVLGGFPLYALPPIQGIRSSSYGLHDNNLSPRELWQLATLCTSAETWLIHWQLYIWAIWSCSTLRLGQLLSIHTAGFPTWVKDFAFGDWPFLFFSRVCHLRWVCPPSSIFFVIPIQMNHSYVYLFTGFDVMNMGYRSSVTTFFSRESDWLTLLLDTWPMTNHAHLLYRVSFPRDSNGFLAVSPATQTHHIFRH